MDWAVDDVEPVEQETWTEYDEQMFQMHCEMQNEMED